MYVHTWIGYVHLDHNLAPTQLCDPSTRRDYQTSWHLYKQIVAGLQHCLHHRGYKKVQQIFLNLCLTIVAIVLTGAFEKVSRDLTLSGRSRISWRGIPVVLSEARSSTRTRPRLYGFNSYFSRVSKISFLLATVNQAPSPALKISNMVSYIHENHGSHSSTVLLISFNRP